MIRFQLDAPAATKPCRSGVSDRAARDRNAIYFSDLGCLGAQCLTAAIVQRRREPTCPSQTPEPPSDDPSGIQRATTLPVSGPDPSAPPAPRSGPRAYLNGMRGQWTTPCPLRPRIFTTAHDRHPALCYAACARIIGVLPIADAIFQAASSCQAVSLSSWLQSGHRKMRISVSQPSTGTTATRFICPELD
jgi:hypothetical protein